LFPKTRVGSSSSSSSMSTSFLCVFTVASSNAALRRVALQY
jgi:hypothetical protein